MSNETTTAEQTTGTTGRLNELVTHLECAWVELQSFGNHPGECTFDGECPTCGAKQGKCVLHKETVTRRLNNMQEKVDRLRDFVGR